MALGLGHPSTAPAFEEPLVQPAPADAVAAPTYSIEAGGFSHLSLTFADVPLEPSTGDQTLLLTRGDPFEESRLKTQPAPTPAPPPAGVWSQAGASRSYGSMFLRAWIPVTAAEFALLGVTAALPKDWTGWSAHFVRDGINHMERAYTQPPVWDDDWWFHNYVGHPYGGSIYYNAVRSQGASPGQSLLFSAVLSTQWEYFFEAFAERPSIQDLIVTPVAGSVLGELTHRFTMHLKKGGTSTGEKLLILLANPMHAAFAGF
jgi:hypothetical protein